MHLGTITKAPPVRPWGAARRHSDSSLYRDTPGVRAPCVLCATARVCGNWCVGALTPNTCRAASGFGRSGFGALRSGPQNSYPPRATGATRGRQVCNGILIEGVTRFGDCHHRVSEREARIAVASIFLIAAVLHGHRHQQLFIFPKPTCPGLFRGEPYKRALCSRLCSPCPHPLSLSLH